MDNAWIQTRKFPVRLQLCKLAISQTLMASGFFIINSELYVFYKRICGRHKACAGEKFKKNHWLGWQKYPAGALPERKNTMTMNERPSMVIQTDSLNPILNRWQGARLGLLFEWTNGLSPSITPDFWASLCQKAGARYAIFCPTPQDDFSDEEVAYFHTALSICTQQHVLTGFSTTAASAHLMRRWKDVEALQIAWTPPHASAHTPPQEEEALFSNHRHQAPPDFLTLERDMGEWLAPHAWETLDWLTLDPHDPLRSPMRSLRTLIHLLVHTATRGGNLLLSVPVSPHGIEDRHQRRLERLGNWLRLYGHTLYDTQAGPYPPQLWGGCTWRENRLYVHVLDWVDEEVSLPLPNGHIRKVTCLTAASIGIQRTSTTLSIRVPPEDQQEADTIIEIELDQPWA